MAVDSSGVLRGFIPHGASGHDCQGCNTWEDKQPGVCITWTEREVN
ncbi:hypothetical protein EYF80_065157 [Liparis tanakae]|uniref:Uncharacterized protein n=1 Tax=Liparis tanakae TaxID=230148 RepID=A0A4Z2E7G1_9TELE|nr:hypothetical protein EYF80_065157 [Liparis tanakae]